MNSSDWIEAIVAVVLLVLVLKLAVYLFGRIRQRIQEKRASHRSRQDALQNKSIAGLTEVDGMDGHAFEYWCAELLRMNGFEKVSVTPGSNDQGVDVLAYKDGLKYGIQCKCYSRDLGNKPVQEATAGRAVYGCDIAVVMTNRHFTKGAVEAAKATGVWLWDRYKLAQMIRNARHQSNA